MRPHTVLARAASIERTDYVRNWGICRRTAREAPTTDYSNRIGAGHAHRHENASGFLIGWLPFAHLGVLTKTQRQRLFLEEFCAACRRRLQANGSIWRLAICSRRLRFTTSIRSGPLAVMIATSPEFRKTPPRAGLLNLGSTVAPPSPLHRRDAKRGLEGVGFRFAAISRGS
jgi:hypothetical protein